MKAAAASSSVKPLEVAAAAAMSPGSTWPGLMDSVSLLNSKMIRSAAPRCSERRR